MHLYYTSSARTPQQQQIFVLQQRMEFSKASYNSQRCAKNKMQQHLLDHLRRGLDLAAARASQAPVATGAGCFGHYCAARRRRRRRRRRGGQTA